MNDKELGKFSNPRILVYAIALDHSNDAASKRAAVYQDLCIPPEVPITVLVAGQSLDLTRVGMRVRKKRTYDEGKTYYVDGYIATRQLPALAKIEQVLSIETVEEAEPELDDSVPESRANDLTFGTQPLTGAGTVVGIIDMGIDWRHGAFRKPDGTSRILAIWDTTLSARGREQPYTDPEGNNLGGVVYTKADLDAALSGTPTMPIRTQDRRGKVKGHGTHVAGIAAGDGSPPSCCRAGGTFVGLAPEADLIVVRSSPTSDAIHFIRDTAPRNVAVVINVSQGLNTGAHDGTSDLEQDIDAFATSRAGRVFVKSAGNEAATRRHIKISVPGSGNKEIKLNVQEDDASARSLEIWYDQGHLLDLEVRDPSGGSIGAVPHATAKTGTVNGQRVSIAGTAPVVQNGDSRFLVRVTPPASRTLAAGTWTLELSNRGAAPAEAHAWLSKDPNWPGFENATKDTTITWPGNARGSITVANYEFLSSGCCSISQINKHSSRGPVRKSAATNPKPDLAAPGTGIDAPQSRNTRTWCLPDCCERYTSKDGTSMSAPHVTGAIALLLQVDPTLYAADVRDILRSAARRDPSYDPNTWGAGKLDVRAAVMEVIQRKTAASPAGRAAAASDAQTRDPAPALGERDAAVAAYAEHLNSARSVTGALSAQLRATENGELCAGIISRHFSEVRRLVNRNRKVATLWHRSNGPALLRRVLQGTLDARAPAPLTDAAQRANLTRFFGQLHRYGSPKLQQAIDHHQQVIMDMLASPLLRQLVKQMATA